MKIEKQQQLIYLSRRKDEVVRLMEKSPGQDFEMALMLGHRLKGHGETFGFPQISSIGLKLELAAKEGDIIKLQTMIVALDECVEENLKILNKQ